MGLDWGMTANGYRFLFKGDENVLELIVMVAHSCEYKKHSNVYFKWVNCMVYGLYHNEVFFTNGLEVKSTK